MYGRTKVLSLVTKPYTGKKISIQRMLKITDMSRRKNYFHNKKRKEKERERGQVRKVVLLNIREEKSRKQHPNTHIETRGK